jgi:hydrogenase-4 component B
MKPIFLSLLLILVSGILPLFVHKRFVILKAIAAGGIFMGCLIGLTGPLAGLYMPETQTAAWTWLHILPLSLRMDTLSAFFLIPIFLIGSLSALYSFHYLHDQTKGLRTAAHYLFFSLLIASMVFVVLAGDMVTFLLAWEFMSISSCFLVVYDYEQKETRHAAYIYFIFTQAGALFIFAAFGVIYAVTGSFNLTSAASLLPDIKLLVFFIAFIGFGSKAGVFPLHIWLPHAHPAAPSHVSALMSGVMIKMGIYGILRLYLTMSPDSIILGRTILTFGIISGVLGVLYAMGQHNLKRLLAYHSIENIGIILIGIGLGMIGASLGNQAMAFLGLTGGLMHVLNHAIFKALLFMGAGSVSHGAGTLAIDRLGGLMKRMRITGLTFLAGSVAICGLPPLNGFVSEFFIYNGAFQGRALEKTDFLFVTLAVISLAVIGGLAVACFTKVTGIVFLGEPRTDGAKRSHESDCSMLYSMTILAACSIAIGLAPALFTGPAAMAAATLLAKAAYDTAIYADIMALCKDISLGAGVFLALLAAASIIRNTFYRAKETDIGPTWGCGFTRPGPRIQYTGASFAASILEFCRPVAPMHEESDGPAGVFPPKASYHSGLKDIAEDIEINWAALPIVRLMRRLRWIQHGNIQLYIAYIVIAIAALLLAGLWR